MEMFILFEIGIVDDGAVGRCREVEFVVRVYAAWGRGGGGGEIRWWGACGGRMGQGGGWE